MWECYKALCSLAASNWVYIYWVSGDMEIHRNELAELARQSSDSLFIGPEPVQGISPRTIGSVCQIS